MTTVETVWLVITIIGVAICIFGLGACVGALIELTSRQRELEREIYDTNRDLEALNKMKLDHETHMQILDEWKVRYEDAYKKAMEIIGEMEIKTEERRIHGEMQANGEAK